ncbi:MAG: 30S ribosomal protein S8 [Rickettsiaceae bacterium]
MSFNDPIADMLTRIRNAYAVKILVTDAPYSKIKQSILDVLKEEGYIIGYTVNGEGSKKTLSIELKYSANGTPAVMEINKISKGSKRIYVSLDNLKGYYNGMGIGILSTSKGVISDRSAISSRVGGELICTVF